MKDSLIFRVMRSLFRKSFMFYFCLFFFLSKIKLLISKVKDKKFQSYGPNSIHINIPKTISKSH